MEKITEQCTGCRACEQLCARKAIQMTDDKEGFLIATINQSLCINCGMCQKWCPQNKSVSKNEAKIVLAARLKDDSSLYRSASGGAFIGIAKDWIVDGGVVVGVVYDCNWNAHHICASSLEELKQMQSSKYVQADTRNTFTEVKNLLQDGKKVLYSGTGCQIGGLKAFLRKDYNNLLTMDLICHGVASPLLFKKYIDWLGEKEGSPITEYDFRDKKSGWGLGYKYKYKNNYKYNSCSADPYFYRFLEGYTYRECCFNCSYCKPERVGDITIGDYWGIEKEHPSFFNTKGVSCILINSYKGIEAWNKYSNKYYSIVSTFPQVAQHNANLLHPTNRDNIRDHIYEGIDTPNWFENTFVASFKVPLKIRIKNLAPMWMKVLIKKIKLHK